MTDSRIQPDTCATPAEENRALSAAEARQRMLDEVSPIAGREFVPVRDALGRILAADIIAPHDVPAHDNSAMDGYGLRYADLAADGDTTLSVIGTAFAGQPFDGALQPGQAVLIQGASSGVGLMAMQIAWLKGAGLVIGSSTDAMRRERLQEFGADLAIDSSDPGWVDQVLQATNGEGVDLIVDQVSGKVANQNLAATKVKGRIVNVGRLGGTHADFNFDLHALKRIDYIGVTFRTRSPEEVRAIVQAARKDLWPAIEAGKLHLPIDRTFPLAEAAEALAHMKANAHFGKIVLVA